MHVVLAEFTIKAEFIEAFSTRVQKQAADSLSSEPECHVFDVCRDPEDAATFLLYEVYTTADDFGAHMQMDYYHAFSADVADWVADKQVRQMTRL